MPEPVPSPAHVAVAECASKPRHCWHISSMGMTGRQINTLVCCHCGQKTEEDGMVQLVPHGKFAPWPFSHQDNS